MLFKLKYCRNNPSLLFRGNFIKCKTNCGRQLQTTCTSLFQKNSSKEISINNELEFIGGQKENRYEQNHIPFSTKIFLCLPIAIFSFIINERKKKSGLQKNSSKYFPIDVERLTEMVQERLNLSIFSNQLNNYLLQGSEALFIPKVVKVNVHKNESTSSSNSTSSSSSDSPSSSSDSTSPSSSSPHGGRSGQSLEELQQELVHQQIRFQKEIEKLEKENRELKKSLLLKEKDGLHKKKIKRSLIDMYSEVLDSLSDYDMTYNVQDQLPRVVVIGDQSAGKTSVLEMIVQARIFPRGSGEMMTKSPVQVTMSEGPYHVARLKDDAKEYDLTKESDLDSLRREIERRMKSSLRKDQTVSQETVSLSVKGPGLQRMVLVDLPGVISTVTTDMADDTREQIKKMCQHHMSNPNSIILCIQDGSLDAERSNVTDLVSSMDPSGRRTIFVLTKVDLAESMLHNPDRIRKILEGKLFPMKAMGYFAVVTGKGNSNDSIQKIKDYEERFFKQSKLFKGGVLRAHQMGTMNLCLAVSQCFWQMVRQSVEQQADAFKATKFNLETEWKNTYPKFREMDREELYEKARGDILDEVVNLSNISAMKWEEVIAENLWSEVSTHFFENIYLPAAHAENAGIFNTAIDIKLKQWADKILPKKSIEVARETLLEEFLNLLTSSSSSSSSSAAAAASNDNDVFHDLKKEIVEELKKRLKWDQQAINSLRVIQMNTLEDRSVHNRQQWDDAIAFMRKVLLNKKSQGEHVMRDMLGPSFWQKYMYWMSRSEEQSLRRSVKNELDKMLLGGNLMHSSKLGKDELIAVRKNLEAQSIDVQDDFIEKTWHIMYRQHFLARRLITAANCQKGFYYYQQGFQDNSVDCSDVVLFWRVERMLQATSKALRQQIMNNETRRLEQDVKQVLDEIYDDKAKMKQLLKGKRVELADEIKKVRHVLELLEEFVQELNKEKT